MSATRFGPYAPTLGGGPAAADAVRGRAGDRGGRAQRHARDRRDAPPGRARHRACRTTSAWSASTTSSAPTSAARRSPRSPSAPRTPAPGRSRRSPPRSYRRVDDPPTRVLPTQLVVRRSTGPLGAAEEPRREPADSPVTGRLHPGAMSPDRRRSVMRVAGSCNRGQASSSSRASRIAGGEAGLHAEGRQDRGDLGAHRPDADAERRGDRLVAQVGRHQGDDLALPLGQEAEVGDAGVLDRDRGRDDGVPVAPGGLQARRRSASSSGSSSRRWSGPPGSRSGGR